MYSSILFIQYDTIGGDMEGDKGRLYRKISAAAVTITHADVPPAVAAYCY